jgi:hypothetical protein
VIKDILWKWDLPKTVEVLLYKTYYFPIVTFGAETCVWSKKVQSRMQAAKMKFLHSSEKVTKWDRLRNEVIRQRVGVHSMEEVRKRRRLEWYGHVKRLEEYRLPERALEMKVTNCKRPVSRP